MDTTFNQSDHDIMISFVATSKIDHATVMERFADIKTDIASLNSTFSEKHTNHELRIQAIETKITSNDLYHAKINLERYSNIAEWAEHLRSNLSFVIALGGVIMVIVGALVSKFLEKLKVF